MIIRDIDADMIQRENLRNETVHGIYMKSIACPTDIPCGI